MPATVFGVAVASLVAVCSLSAQGSTPAAADAGQAQARTATDSTAASQVKVDTIGFGGRTIAAGDTVRGTVVVAAGDLHVAGTILGNAITIAGDVVVDRGGSDCRLWIGNNRGRRGGGRAPFDRRQLRLPARLAA